MVWFFSFSFLLQGTGQQKGHFGPQRKGGQGRGHFGPRSWVSVALSFRWVNRKFNGAFFAFFAFLISHFSISACVCDEMVTTYKTFPLPLPPLHSFGRRRKAPRGKDRTVKLKHYSTIRRKTTGFVSVCKKRKKKKVRITEAGELVNRDIVGRGGLLDIELAKGGSD